jgi:uncharacterized Ntn-hydrolase superfamily protein
MIADAAATPDGPWPSPDDGWTLSVVAHDPATEGLGLAIAASSVAIGARCPLIAAGRAAVTSQGFSNLKLGPLAVDLLGRGLAAHEVMHALRQHDRWMDYRQIAIISAGGEIEAHTGAMNVGWAGHLVEGDAVALGNGLPDHAALTAMKAALRERSIQPLAERLLGAIRAGRAVLVDRSTAVSSALLVRAPGDLVPIDLRIDLSRATPDEGGDAVADLDRLYATYAPLVATYERRSLSPRPGKETPAAEPAFSAN